MAFAGRRHSTQTDLFFVHLRRKTHFRSDRDAKIESARRAMSKDPQYKEEKKEEAKPAEKKEEAKPAEKKEEAKPAEKKEENKESNGFPLTG